MSIYTKDNKWQSDRGGRGPQKTCFGAYIVLWHDPMGFAMRGARKVVW